jgi:hypothetical protein
MSISLDIIFFNGGDRGYFDSKIVVQVKGIFYKNDNNAEIKLLKGRGLPSLRHLNYRLFIMYCTLGHRN